MERDLSYHSLIILRVCCDDFGPPLVKLFNSWLLKEGFHETVRKACVEFLGYGNPDMMFLNKFKQLEKAIRCWKSNVMKEETKEMEEIKKRMVELNWWRNRDA